MKSMGCYRSLSPLLFMMKMMVWYFVSKFIKVMTDIIIVDISMFFIDMNSEVWFFVYGYLDGVVARHGSSSTHRFHSILSRWGPSPIVWITYVISCFVFPLTMFPTKTHLEVKSKSIFCWDFFRISWICFIITSWYIYCRITTEAMLMQQLDHQRFSSLARPFSDRLDFGIWNNFTHLNLFC